MASISITTVYLQLPFVPSSPSESSNTANALPQPPTTKNQVLSNNTTSASSFVDDGSVYISLNIRLNIGKIHVFLTFPIL